MIPAASFRTARILIVDDEDANVEMLRSILTRAGFSKIESTTDSREAAALYVRRGHVWRRKGDVARAVADYSEALRIAPAMLGAQVARGITLETAGDRNGARADYQATIAAVARGEAAIRAQLDT